jgi:hypothetical protein
MRSSAGRNASSRPYGIGSLHANVAELFAVVALGLAWFALRRGEQWAFWFLVVGSLIGVPYYLIIAATYAAWGARLGTTSVPAFLGRSDRRPGCGVHRPTAGRYRA